MSRPPRWLVVTPVLGALAFGAAGAWFYLAQRQYLHQVASASLLAIAQAKLDQIVAWRAERLGDAAILQESPFFLRTVARWLEGREPEVAADILTLLRSTKDNFGYDDVRLVDRAGRVLLATSGRRGPLGATAAAALRAAFRDRRPTMSDVHVSSDDSFPHLSVVAPLFAPSGRVAVPIGAVVLIVDARRSLFRLVASWPSPSPSAEANLVRRDGDSVLFLTPRRFQPDPVSPVRVSLSRRDVPAVMAALGTEGIVRGADYRGVRVISALRAVPGTPWFLVAKVDEVEALAVWRTRVALVFAVLLGLVLAAGATAIVLGQRSAAARYRKLYEAEAALGASEGRYRTLVEEAGDGFALLDADGRYLDVNSARCRQLGYAREELLRLSISDIDLLFSPQRFAADFQSLLGRPPVTYESEHRRKDGTTFPVEVTLSIVRIGGVPQALSLARDITERKRAAEALRESEERFRLAILTTFNAVWDWNLQTDAVWWNEGFQTLFGYRAEEIEPGIESWRNRIHPEDLDRVTAGIHAAIDSGRQNWSDQYRFRRGDGSYAVVEDRGCVTRTANCIPVRMLGAMQDITERARGEEALRRSETLLNTTQELSKVGGWEYDVARRRMTWTAQLYRLHDLPQDGITPGSTEHIDRSLECYSPEDRPTILRAFQRCAQTGEPYDLEFPFTTFAGRRLWIRTIARAERKNGEVVRVVGNVIDITELKRAEETLRKNEANLTALVENTKDRIWAVDADYRLIVRNAQFLQGLGGVPQREFALGESAMLDSLPQAAQDKWRSYYDRALRGESFSVEEEAQFQEEPAFVDFRFHPIRSAEGGISGVVVSGRDITERKQAEAALRALARHLDSVREEEHTRIARQIHDELGQALTALRLDLTWVARKIPKEKTALRRRIDAAVALTDETITVGQRIVGELRPPILEDLGLVPAVEWYAQHFAKRSGLRIEFDVGTEEPAVPDHLAVTAYRVVQEALTNVARHAQATHASVRLGEQDGALTIEIRDDGQGLPEEVMRSPHSFGIVGMRERAASHGGELAITSSPGAGTTVRVTFPLERRNEPRAPR